MLKSRKLKRIIKADRKMYYHKHESYRLLEIDFDKSFYHQQRYAFWKEKFLKYRRLKPNVYWDMHHKYNRR